MVLSGGDLSSESIAACVTDPGFRVSISSASAESIARSHQFLQAVATRRLIYGVNTGFGPMASCVLPADQLVQLQYNLVRSHAVGAGEPIEQRYALAAMVVRLNTLCRGVSAVSPALCHTLQEFINHRIIPVIPRHGAVGTSGDLVQLAHVALALIGEGEVFYRGLRVSTADALAECGLRPHVLQIKEGLALINGTAVMTGIAALLCVDTQVLVELAIRNGALSLEITEAFNDGISEALNGLRPHRGQQAVAERLRSAVRGSTRLRNRDEALAGESPNDQARRLPHPVQEVYSVRCIPQILGPVLDTLNDVTACVDIEMNSATDNPAVLCAEERIVHGGNFHGEYVAAAIDRLKAAVIKSTLLSERRLNFLLNASVNRRLPEFLNLGAVGLNLGLQGLQFVATSTAARSQSLGYPHYLHSIPTNGDNQDVVSLGTDAALIAHEAIAQAFVVQSIEAIALAQAVDCLSIRDQISASSRAVCDVVRQIVPAVVSDRPLSGELNHLTARLRQPLPPVAYGNA